MSSLSKMRCDFCRRKIVQGYEFKCACGKLCCIVCRMPEEHPCEAQVKLKKIKLDKVVADKLKDKV